MSKSQFTTYMFATLLEILKLMYLFILKSLSKPTYPASIHQPSSYAAFPITLFLFLSTTGFVSSHLHRAVTSAQCRYVFWYRLRTNKFMFLKPPDFEPYSLKCHYGWESSKLNFSKFLWESYDVSQLHAVSHWILDWPKAFLSRLSLCFGYLCGSCSVKIKI